MLPVFKACRPFIVFLKTCFVSSEQAQNEFEHPTESETNRALDQEITHAIQGERPKLSFTSILKIGFIKLAKLNFTSISSIAFHMVHCVTINNNLHLYLYGDVQCYYWWQKLILFGLLPIVVLYPLSFGISLDLLKERWISPSTFLFATVMPFFTFALYVKKKIVGLEKHNYFHDDEICKNEILAMEEELFAEESKVLRWPVVQLYRNLLPC